MILLFLVMVIGFLALSNQIYLLKQSINEGNQIMSALSDAIDALGAKIEANTTVIGSVEQLVQNLAAAIEALKAELAAAGVDPAIIAKVEALQTKLETDDAALAALVVANAPPVVPPVG